MGLLSQTQLSDWTTTLWLCYCVITAPKLVLTLNSRLVYFPTNSFSQEGRWDEPQDYCAGPLGLAASTLLWMPRFHSSRADLKGWAFPCWGQSSYQGMLQPWRGRVLPLRMCGSAEKKPWRHPMYQQIKAMGLSFHSAPHDVRKLQRQHSLWDAGRLLPMHSSNWLYSRGLYKPNIYYVLSGLQFAPTASLNCDSSPISLGWQEGPRFLAPPTPRCLELDMPCPPPHHTPKAFLSPPVTQS